MPRDNQAFLRLVSHLRELLDYDDPSYKRPSEAEEAEMDRRAAIAARHGYRGPQSELS